MVYTNMITPLAAEPAGTSVSWWVILLIVFIGLALLIWLMTRKVAKDDNPVKMARHSGSSHSVPAERHSVPAERHSVPTPTAPDNIEIIEGIGPKIASLLRKAGISTFVQLANTDVAQLKKLMSEANLPIADPTTWPDQARLAAEGKQAELKALQASLRAGRKA